MVDPISLIAAIAAVISAVKDGRSMFKKWREKRRQERETTDDLEKALDVCPDCSMYLYIILASFEPFV